MQQTSMEPLIQLPLEVLGLREKWSLLSGARGEELRAAHGNKPMQINTRVAIKEVL